MTYYSELRPAIAVALEQLSSALLGSLDHIEQSVDPACDQVHDLTIAVDSLGARVDGLHTRIEDLGRAHARALARILAALAPDPSATPRDNLASASAPDPTPAPSTTGPLGTAILTEIGLVALQAILAALPGLLGRISHR